ncbi:hypothetical protein BDZ97DRAFT_2065989 [Flammula alnicola]|nr:hypothetical protein BDZ97DRAFT_2065989 [Flammula alnicola]
MVSFKKLFTSVFLAVAYTQSAAAAPWPLTSKHATHRARQVTRELNIETYHPPSIFEVNTMQSMPILNDATTQYKTFEAGIDHPHSKRGDNSLKDAAVAFVESHLSLDKGALAYQSGYSGDVAQHAYLKQAHISGVLRVFFRESQEYRSLQTLNYSRSRDRLRQSDPRRKIQRPPRHLEYVVKADNTAVLTHVVQIQNDETGAWVEAFIDAHSGELVTITDFVAKASYLVLPLQKETLTDGFETLTDPQDLTASPDGWHSTGTTSYTNSHYPSSRARGGYFYPLAMDELVLIKGWASLREING